MEVLTTQEAASLLEVDDKTVYRLIKRDGLPAFKVGRAWRIRMTDLEAWIDDQLRAREAAATYATQRPLFAEPEAEQSSPLKPGFSDSAFTENADALIHGWVPWIAGFSSAFVGDALDHYLDGSDGPKTTVMDPFAGVGTTLVTALLRGHSVMGWEVNPYAAEVCRLKLDVRRIPADILAEQIEKFESEVRKAVQTGAEPELAAPAGFRTRRAFFSPPVKRKVLLARQFAEGIENDRVRRCFRVALASEMVGFSNYSYEPSLGTRAAAGKRDVDDAPVVRVIAAKLRQMLRDIREVQGRPAPAAGEGTVSFHQGDFFAGAPSLPDESIDIIVTSPPYLNNYHYIRNSRPQVYWLGHAQRPADLKPVEQQSFGKYWQTVRAEGEIPLTVDLPEVRGDIAFLRTINTHKAEYGGNGWANYAATYFNDCDRFAAALARLLRPGGRAVVVLGNSILQGVEFQTDRIFARVCELHGLELEDIVTLRQKRTGTSIIKSSVRTSAARARTTLYESAVVVVRPA